jgi:hypothetical protein
MSQIWIDTFFWLLERTQNLNYEISLLLDLELATKIVK